MVIFKDREFEAVRTNEYGENEYLWEGEWFTEPHLCDLDLFPVDYTRSVRLVNGDAENPDFDTPYFDDSHGYYEDAYDQESDLWDAMTDGMYGDMPDGFDGDYDFLG